MLVRANQKLAPVGAVALNPERIPEPEVHEKKAA